MEKEEKIPFLDIDEMYKKGKDILIAIAPMFKGKSIEYIDSALGSARHLLQKECVFILRSSVKRHKI
jgi:hypothetical protein